MKNLNKTQAETADGFIPMLRLEDVRKVLACSSRVVLDLIAEGKLHAYTLYGEVDRSSVDKASGIRVTQSSLRAYLDNAEIR